MNRASAVAGSAVFLVLAPGTVAVLIPWWLCRWQLAPPLFDVFAARIAGVALIVAGLPVLLDSFVQFALQGLGTPAPAAPTEHLVVSGWYRYVRNPMYLAVVALVLGQGLFFGSVHVLEYGVAAWLVMQVFVLIYEEPTLKSKFGEEYEAYCRNVRRWWPRVSAWKAVR
jgi:protein-S-isoprenylcysteine O-methyltransferase Ste14